MTKAQEIEDEYLAASDALYQAKVRFRNARDQHHRLHNVPIDGAGRERLRIADLREHPEHVRKLFDESFVKEKQDYAPKNFSACHVWTGGLNNNNPYFGVGKMVPPHHSSARRYIWHQERTLKIPTQEIPPNRRIKMSKWCHQYCVHPFHMSVAGVEFMSDPTRKSK